MCAFTWQESGNTQSVTVQLTLGATSVAQTTEGGRPRHAALRSSLPA